jgi:hypothetical protein
MLKNIYYNTFYYTLYCLEDENYDLIKINNKNIIPLYYLNNFSLIRDYNDNVKFIKQIFVTKNEYKMNNINYYYHHFITYNITNITDLKKFYKLNTLHFCSKIKFASTFGIVELLKFFNNNELQQFGYILIFEIASKFGHINILNWMYNNINFQNFIIFNCQMHDKTTIWFDENIIDNISECIKIYKNNNISIIKINNKNCKDIIDECVICYENSNIKTFCKHDFCNKCFIKHYLINNNKLFCVYCNQSLNNNLYLTRTH